MPSPRENGTRSDGPTWERFLTVSPLFTADSVLAGSIALRRVEGQKPGNLYMYSIAEIELRLLVSVKVLGSGALRRTAGSNMSGIDGYEPPKLWSLIRTDTAANSYVKVERLGKHEGNGLQTLQVVENIRRAHSSSVMSDGESGINVQFLSLADFQIDFDS